MNIIKTLLLARFIDLTSLLAICWCADSIAKGRWVGFNAVVIAVALGLYLGEKK